MRARAAVGWLLAPRRRWWAAGSVAAALVLATVAAVALPPQDDDQLTERVAGAVARPDPVPEGPIVTSIPPGCGISFASLDELVGTAPGEEVIDGPDKQRCTWDTGFPSFGDYRRTLEVFVEKAHERQLGLGRVQATAQEFAAQLANRQGAGAVRPVVGLGTEAVTWSSGVDDGTRSSVLFWEGNLLGYVAYGGDLESLTEKAATRRALAAAGEVARSMELGVDGGPRVGRAPDGVVHSVPKACDLLPAALERELGKPGYDEDPEDAYLFDDDTEAPTGGGCGFGYDLSVEVESVSASELGTGEQVASRRYLQLYLDARTRAPDADVEGSESSAVSVRGVGDEGFLDWERDTSSTGRMVFRVRNVLVRVSVRGLHAEDLSRRDALDRAYGAGVAAARAVGE